MERLAEKARSNVHGSTLPVTKKWNPSTHKQVYSWRYDPRELGATQAPEADPGRRNARRV